MKRANLFSLAPTREQDSILKELAVNCAKLWNEVNYLHRQQYRDYLRLDWNPQLYKKYVSLVGSATAQQVVRKNNEAWRSFLALKRMEKRGELPSAFRRLRMPGYWKRDGDTCCESCFAATATTYGKIGWICRIISLSHSRAS